jgi:hypothetical protein
MKSHAIRLENLPEPFSPECATYRAKLGTSLPMTGSDMYAFSPLWAHGIEEDQPEPQSDLESESHRSVAGPSGYDAQTTIFTSTNYDLVSRSWRLPAQTEVHLTFYRVQLAKIH